MSHDFLPKTFSGYNAAMAPDGFIDGFLDAQAALDFADFQRGLAYSEYSEDRWRVSVAACAAGGTAPAQAQADIGKCRTAGDEGRHSSRALRRPP